MGTKMKSAKIESIGRGAKKPAKVKIKGISFSDLLAGKVADGSKTMTRRLLATEVMPDTVRIDLMLDKRVACPLRGNGQQSGAIIPVPFTVGQLLYVRESWQAPAKYYYPSGSAHIPDDAEIAYLSDNGGRKHEFGGRKRLARFMPARFARTFLRVTGVRCERLMEITEDDAVAEGGGLDWPIGYIPAYEAAPYTYCFAQLWDHINHRKTDPKFADNPWVWVISFDRVEMANPWNVDLPWKPTWTKCDGDWLYGNRDHVLGCDYAITVAYDQISTAWDWSVSICGKQTDAGYSLSADEAKSDAVKAYRKSSKGIAPNLL